jgi:hypothetical protein
MNRQIRGVCYLDDTVRNSSEIAHSFKGGVAFLIFAWSFKVLIPVERSPLLEVSVEHLPTSLEADLNRLALIDLKMQAAATAPTIVPS